MPPAGPLSTLACAAGRRGQAGVRTSSLNAKKAFEDLKQNAVEQRALFGETFDQAVFKSMEKVRKLRSMIL